MKLVLHITKPSLTTETLSVIWSKYTDKKEEINPKTSGES